MLLGGAKPEICIPGYPVPPNVESEDQMVKTEIFINETPLKPGMDGKVSYFAGTPISGRNPQKPAIFGLLLTCFCWEKR